jgi:hypothetical protein
VLSVPAILYAAYAVPPSRPASRCATRQTRSCSSSQTRSCSSSRKALSEQLSTFCACVLLGRILSMKPGINIECSDPVIFVRRTIDSVSVHINVFEIRLFVVKSILFNFCISICEPSRLPWELRMCPSHPVCSDRLVSPMHTTACCSLNVRACRFPYFRMQFQFPSSLKYANDKLHIILFGRKFAFGFLGFIHECFYSVAIC